MANKQKIAKWHKNKTNTWLNNQGEAEQKINNNAGPADIINKGKWHIKYSRKRRNIGVNQMLGQLFWRNGNGKRKWEKSKVQSASCNNNWAKVKKQTKRMGTYADTHTHTHTHQQLRDCFALLFHWISLIFPSFWNMFRFALLFYWLLSDRFVALRGKGLSFTFLPHLRVCQTI